VVAAIQRVNVKVRTLADFYLRIFPSTSVAWLKNRPQGVSVPGKSELLLLDEIGPALANGSRCQSNSSNRVNQPILD
jgi:hypothetical protein